MSTPGTARRAEHTYHAAYRTMVLDLVRRAGQDPAGLTVSVWPGRRIGADYDPGSDHMRVRAPGYCDDPGPDIEAEIAVQLWPRHVVQETGRPDPGQRATTVLQAALRVNFRAAVVLLLLAVVLNMMLLIGVVWGLGAAQAALTVAHARKAKPYIRASQSYAAALVGEYEVLQQSVRTLPAWFRFLLQRSGGPLVR